MDDKKIRVRFAPSPTGYLHIGGARTALFNYLYAKHCGGTFVLRIEDTDLERSTKASEQVILDNLKWLGLDWDEGVEVGGPYGPYRQTERLDLYRRYAQELVDEGKAYYCYCSPEELEAERQAALSKGETPRYSGRCRCLSDTEKAKFEAEGRKPVIRFHIPAGQTIVIDDVVRGQVVFQSDDFGDFVIIKSDGVAAYNFAVVVDDALMKITHVIRGEDHLTNTARQIILYNSLNFPLPVFAHISLILGPDRTKLSKRHGNTAVDQYKADGFLPEAMFNFLALLGWSPDENRELFSREQLVEAFSLERIVKNPAVFDIDKLKWINSQYIKEADLDRLTKLIIPYLQQAGYVGAVSEEEFLWLRRVTEAIRGYLEYLAQAPQVAKVFFEDDFTLDEEAKQILSEQEVPGVLKALVEKIGRLQDYEHETIKGMFKEIGKEYNVKGKNLFMPARVAMTGSAAGPELPMLISVLGKERVAKRICHCLSQIGIDMGEKFLYNS